MLTKLFPCPKKGRGVKSLVLAAINLDKVFTPDSTMSDEILVCRFSAAFGRNVCLHRFRVFIIATLRKSLCPRVKCKENRKDVKSVKYLYTKTCK